MWRRSIGIALLLGLGAVAPTWAGLAVEVTGAGQITADPTLGLVDRSGISDLFYGTNNDLVAAPTMTGGTGLADGISGMSSDGLGYILYGPADSLMTYDRLAYVPVVQLLGTINVGDGLTYSRPEPMPPAQEEIVSLGGSGDMEASTDSVGPASPPIYFVPDPIPEPASLLLVLAGAGLMTGRGSRTPTHARKVRIRSGGR